MKDEKYTIASTVINFSTKADGSMKSTDGSNGLENIYKFLLTKKLPPHFVKMQQIHGGDVAVVDGSQDVVPDVDGLVTATRNLSLCILTADCLPVLFFDPQKSVIAAAHAGSKGLTASILHNVIETMEKTFGTNPSDLQVTIGPSIEQKCYEVGQEVIERFAKQFSWFDESFYSDSPNGRYLLDLRKIALQCLIKERILKEHITVEDACTKCSVDTYYSYRRGDTTERFVSAISLV